MTSTLDGFANTAIWPPRGAAPIDAATKADYFDSMYHSAATVGLNTSALIEAGIVGRAVHTMLLPEFYENQEGTLHFRYLLEGGLLRHARDLDTHVAQLAESLATADSARSSQPSVRRSASSAPMVWVPRRLPGLRRPSRTWRVSAFGRCNRRAGSRFFER